MGLDSEEKQTGSDGAARWLALRILAMRASLAYYDKTRQFARKSDSALCQLVCPRQCRCLALASWAIEWWANHHAASVFSGQVYTLLRGQVMQMTTRHEFEVIRDKLPLD